jgi:ribosome-binding factor A
MRYRKLRVQDLLREEISSIIHKDMRDPGIGFVTILEVKMSEDLKNAKVYCSVYGSDEERQKTLGVLRKSKGYVRFLIGQRLTLRYTPEINFVLDDAFERVERIEQILKKEEQEHDRED